MNQLNGYQKRVVGQIELYAQAYVRERNLTGAWNSYWDASGVPTDDGKWVKPYNDNGGGVPRLCVKVPTGGGKTIIGVAALKKLFETFGPNEPRVVVWLVPSEAILTQTIRNFSSNDCWYRQRLLADFNGRVEVYDKDSLLNGQNFSPDTVRENLSVCVLCFNSLRINARSQADRKVFQENGLLEKFATDIATRESVLANVPETALIQALRAYHPVVVVDETHNAETQLSREMLENLSPSFIIGLTATPKESDNVISYVSASELKTEHMVKLPVVVYRRASYEGVLTGAIQLRRVLEKRAKELAEKGGSKSGKEARQIRPIVLFQAEPQIGEESVTFRKIEKRLIDAGIPSEQIKIKAAQVDTLGGIDLMAEDCPVRYIITVNALQEGWDCPFAYILASLANKTSRTQVEQIVGRILRQPYAEECADDLLNTSYVFSCSADFQNTVDSVVAGLNCAGFGKADCRTPDPVEPVEGVTGEQLTLEGEPVSAEGGEPVERGDEEVSAASLRSAVQEDVADLATTADVSTLVSQATAESKAYEESSGKDAGPATGLVPGGERMKQYSVRDSFVDEIRDLRLPKFVFRPEGEITEKEVALEDLESGFSLATCDASVDFSLSDDDVAQVDVGERNVGVKYLIAPENYRAYLAKILATKAPEEKLEYLVNRILYPAINRDNRIASPTIRPYLSRVLEGLGKGDADSLVARADTLVERIKQKIRQEQFAYRKRRFRELLAAGELSCRPSYRLPDMIIPFKPFDTLGKSLYKAEWGDKLNPFEREVIEKVAGLENVKWWHRNPEKRGKEDAGFIINGCLNHIPDFIVRLNSGRIVVIETKGDDRDNSDSREKAELGAKWCQYAGLDKYRYFMAFETKDLQMDGVVTIPKLLELMKRL